MLTYQLQDRIYRVEDDGDLVFPNDVVIEMILEPATPFGAPGSATRTAVKSQPARVIWDGNSGRGIIQSEATLEPLRVVAEYANLRMELQGNKLIMNTRCKDLDELNEVLSGMYYVFPFLLNLEIADPPVVKRVYGRVGERDFRWELKEFRFEFDITTTEEQEKRVASSFERLQTMSGVLNRRVAAALYYFYVACRLIATGNSPWEFMAETVLNLSKVLQVLFGEQRDDVRRSLKQLGYSEDEIECDFIPAMILRNEFDVGHATVSILKREELDSVYTYLISAETTFRSLLKHVIHQVQIGVYEVAQESDLSLNSEKRQIMQQLIKNFQRRQQS